MPGQSIRRDIPEDTLVNISDTGTFDQLDAIANKQKCQNAFFKILCSDKFALLCNLLCESFQGINTEKLFEISQINSKMKMGVYELSPELFNQDLQQIWRKFKKVGEEMVLLANCLSNMSEEVHQKQVGDDLAGEACLKKCEENSQVVAARNSNESDTGTQFPSCESVPSNKVDQTEASGLYKICTCKQCGNEADLDSSLTCIECEAVYHFSCADPTVQEISTRTWHCTSCAKERTQSSEPPVKNTEDNGIHDNCAVCERLEISEPKELINDSDRTAVANASRESSVSSMESDELPEPSRTALARLCKHCGTCEDEDKRFLICGHSQCPYKYYHIRCLTTSQIASLQQIGQHCWYCPSCLCRACYSDRDDDLIVLCDNCDEAYHTYCMRPPHSSIPKGQWYCLKCNVVRAKEGMRRYENLVLQLHGKKDLKQGNEGNRSMDVLLSAVDKLSSEENLAAGKNQE
ncbi:uncharacterized protein A4U43_C04F27540 [Asparagus officinalis]|uniref:PHD-type domain-containing protein n=2 Tax=Asparagus officinalis TaxID=4686 RepID=A0A5P1F430_ASPOF|nr:uncharacterized protein A4U43_C04F27540 [Asparagus officinalis]